MRTIRFYKEGDLWYADLPEYIAAGGTKEDCLMVEGADTWLNFLADGDEVTLKVSAMERLKEMLIRECDLGMEGAWYYADKYKGIVIYHDIWLCPVTLFVFDGVYPQKIYYEKV
jgi:hypothetical protein